MKYRRIFNQKPLNFFVKLLAFYFVIFFVSDICSFAGTYYISANGSNYNNGSITQPWSTIMHGIRNTVPGDTILLRGGTYPQQEEMWIRNGAAHGGTSGKWKTIKAYPEETVRLSQRVIVDADYIRVQGLHLRDGSTITVYEEDSPTSHVEILDNYFTGGYNVSQGH